MVETSISRGDAMIICICRAINEQKINQSIDGGAVTAKQIYGSLGVKPKCGKCRPEIQDMIDTALQKRAQQAAFLEQKLLEQQALVHQTIS
jgi:bacterioferritin-associated ferredoxin